MTQSSTDQATAGATAGTTAGTTESPADATTSTRESSIRESSIHESLSALVDSEASEMELHRLLKLSESDPDIRSQWRRYHLIRGLLKGELETDPTVDLSDRISAAIAQEDSLQIAVQGPDRSRQWRDGFGKLAIAASVAFAFVVGIQQFSAPGDMSPEQIAESSESGAAPLSVAGGVPAGFELPPFAARTVSTGPGLAESATPFAAYPSANPSTTNTQLQNNQALQNYFNYLLLKHAERSSANGGMGLLPFARVSRMDATQE